MGSKLCWFLVAGLVFSRSLSRAQEPERTLSLEESVRLALSNSHQLLLTQEDVNVATQRVRQAQTLFFPKLDFNASVSKFRVEEADRPLLLQPSLAPNLITASPRENFYTARADIIQTIYAGGRHRNTLRLAKVALERARSAHDALGAQVAVEAKEAFYHLLLAQEKGRLYAAALRQLQTLGEKGTGLSGASRLRWEGERLSLRAEAARCRNEEEQARLAFLNALNLELRTSVALQGELKTTPIELDLQKVLAWADQYRPELRQTEFQEEIDALGISLSLAERTPTVSLGATYERSDHDLAFRTANWAGTVNVNLPFSISDAFYGWARVRERRAQYRQASLRKTNQSDNVHYQVRQAYQEYRFWQEELGIRGDEQHRMDALAETLWIRWKSRAVDTADLAQAERLRLEAHVRYREAVHGHLIALAMLERAVGRPLAGD